MEKEKYRNKSGSELNVKVKYDIRPEKLIMKVHKHKIFSP